MTKEFDRDGYANIGTVLDHSELAFYKDRLVNLFEKQNGLAAGSVYRNLSDHTDHSAAASAVLQIVNVHKTDPAFEDLIRKKEILDAVKDCLASEVHLLRDQAFFKPPRSGGEVYMHQDNRYWHLDPPLAVTIWIPFDDATIENGCVFFIKGSHTAGKVKHAAALNGVSVQMEAEADKELSTANPLKAGAASIHHCMTLHWSPPNTSPNARLAFSIQYISDRVTRYKDGLVISDLKL